jgi:hypothetical protein
MFQDHWQFAIPLQIKSFIFIKAAHLPSSHSSLFIMDFDKAC